jgi:hypothetical protein
VTNEFWVFALLSFACTLVSYLLYRARQPSYAVLPFIFAAIIFGVFAEWAGW